MARRPVHEEAFLGESRRVQVTFTVADVETAPSGNPTYTQITPGGVSTSTTSGWTNPSTGIYYRDVDFDTVGTWKIKVSTTALSSHYAASYGEIAVVDPQST